MNKLVDDSFIVDEYFVFCPNCRRRLTMATNYTVNTPSKFRPKLPYKQYCCCKNCRDIFNKKLREAQNDT